jgi:cytochrome c oxidase subunit I
VASVAEHGAGHGAHHGAPVAPRRRGFLMRPGWIRALWVTPLFFLIGMYIVVALRWLGGWDPIYNWTIIVLVGGLVMAPLGFLVGLGAFDYWLYYLSGRPTVPDDHASHGAKSWRSYFGVNTDHKVIGVQYTSLTFVFFAIGGLMAMLFRAELAEPGMQFFDSQTFNGLVSVHATLLIFLFIVPVFAGLGNFVIPLMLGAPDMAFPRLNALSFWFLPIAGVMFLCSFVAPGGPFAAGWTGYAPLSTDTPVGSMFFNMGVQWAGASSIATALNFLVTIITMRAPGMTFWRMPLLVWANFTTSLLVVLATPFIAGSQFFVLFDRVMHTSFFVPEGGGYVLGYQHIFWFYSHPAVYIMILPGFGIISEVLAVMSRKPVFGYRLMAISLLGILVLGFSVWAHHMFVAGMAEWLKVPMMISTLLIAVPTGVKVFSWISTMWRGKIQLNTPMLFAVGFISMFLLGGLSGLFLGSVPITMHASDTYFIVAHIHYVLFGGSVFTIFAGAYYWFPKMTGRMYNETLGKAHFWITFVAFNLTFFPMHWVGLDGMPRRVFDYATEYATLNLIVSIASFALGASLILFFYNVIISWMRGPLAGDNPWRAMTIEWQVTSPPPIFNFDEIPTVVGGPYEYGVPGARHVIMTGGTPAPTKEAHA